MRLSIATVCLSGTLEDKLDAIAAAGFDGVEIFENDLVASAWSPARIGRECASRGLGIDLYQPFRDFEAVPPAAFRAGLRRAERKFDVMEQLGARTMLVCSSVAAECVDDDELAAEQLRELAERAGRRGLRIAYEALAWGKHVDTYAHSWRIVRRADHPALGLCLDSFHILSRGDDPAGIGVIPGPKVFFLQLADAPHLDMNVVEWSRHHRLFPGLGSFDLPALVRHVLATGYDGPLSLEIFNDIYRQTDPRHAAVDGIRSLLALRESASGPLPGLPSPPRLAGNAFTELSVDALSGPAVTHALTALGFARTQQRPPGAAEVWQQGAARIVLTPTPATAVPGAAGISAVGVTSADPAASLARAQRLLVPVLPGGRAVAAPDGTVIHFGPHDAGAPREALPHAAAPEEALPTTRAAEQAPPIVTGIDHIALTEQVDDYDQVALFLRTVLGLRPGPGTELTAPFGLLRGRSATDADGTFRIIFLTAPLRRGSWAPAVPSPQHVSFASPDIVASARAARALGAPVLPIPGNYYDDLDVRLAPPPELLADLREHSIMYDRDGGGEYFHFATELLGSRLFFEVVQRVGGYEGYGAANAVPVRMAAHRRQRLRRAGSVKIP
mgnify:CR=1 FL=1